ncbi:MAG: tyrosine-type recombinase/integrase [Thiolinea sp.]
METVEAVKDKDQIAGIKSLLKVYGGSDLYSDIWSFGINSALRISDLLAIKYADIENSSITLKEGKTGKTREITLNNSAIDVVTRRHNDNPNDIYLFQVHSNRASGKPVSRESVARMFKKVGDKLKIKLGTHSMRKTRGYAMYKAGASIELVCKVLNHSSTATTLRYIGIEKEDVQRTYDLEL